jgi:hypothetical protein
MIYPASIIAVDDTDRELEAIVRALRLLDAACLPILVTATRPNVAAPLSGVRLVFFDINYLPGVSGNTAIFEIAATVLCGVLAKDNGPYVLITWTSKTDLHEEFMAFLAKEVPDLPPPAVTACLAKEKFVLAGDESGTGVHGGPSLQEEIQSVLCRHTEVAALLLWEMSARRAAGDVVSSLLGLLNRDDRFSGRCGPGLRGLLTHIAQRAVGVGQVANNRKAAINEALVPILFDRLMHQTPSGEDAGVWPLAIPLTHPSPHITAEQAAKLNSLNHIALPSSGPIRAGDRGVVFSFGTDAGQYVAAKAGIDIQVLAAQYVETQHAGENQTTPPDMNELANLCRWVFLGTRAVCDQAQGNGIMRPVVLGLEVPGSWREGGRGLRIRKHSAQFLTPSFLFELPRSTSSADRRIVINWHWTMTLSPAELDGCQPLYRFREAVINQITSASSHYTSRPGIINFE